jgi:hypothetical protein
MEEPNPMRHLAIAAGLAAALLGAATAEAQPYPHYYHHHHHYRHYERARCEEDRRHAANTGTLVGGVAGALAGNALASGGGKLGGTLIGGGVGAVAGHQIASNGHHC